MPLTPYPQLPRVFVLNELQEGMAANWLQKPAVRKLMANEGSFAVVFGPSNGIGRATMVTVKDKDGNTLMLDVTDVGSW
jgi:hypothetical protein